MIACGQGCSGHGTCDNLHGGCQCSEGWHGTHCDMVACPNDCSNNGVCIGGKCMCKSTHFGAGCQNLRCLHDCSNRGYCFEGKCQCEDGYGGIGCTELLQSSRVVRLEVPAERRPSGGLATLEASTIRSALQADRDAGCMGHGTLLKSGRCLCAKGWTGTACSDFCPEDCSGHGSCAGGACVCSDGYRGADCAILEVVAMEFEERQRPAPSRTCPQSCSGHGTCTEPNVCMCKVGWVGEACSMPNITSPQRSKRPAATPAGFLASKQDAAGDPVDAEQPEHFSGHLRDDAAPQTAAWIPVASEAPKSPSNQLSSDRSKERRLALLGVAATAPRYNGKGTLALLLSAAARQGRKQAISAPVPATKPGQQQLGKQP